MGVSTSTVAVICSGVGRDLWAKVPSPGRRPGDLGSAVRFSRLKGAAYLPVPPFEFFDALLQAGDFRLERLVLGDQLVDLLGLTTDDLEKILLSRPRAHGQHGNGRSARPEAGHPSDR